MKIQFPYKTIELLLIFFFLSSNLYSQIDSSAESFFPRHVGDVWEYDNINSVYKIILTKDSIIQGSSFLYYNNGSVPYYAIDSLLNVIQYPTISNWTNLRININTKIGGWWISKDMGGGYKILGKVDTLYWGYLFNVVTQIKEIGYYYGKQENDTTIFINWRNTDYYAAGIGFFLSQYDAGLPDEYLLGCIINGRKYGTVSSVFLKPGSQIPSAYKLFPAFPNPFNPSTIIGYLLPVKNNVDIQVYDMLGRAIETLVKEEQQAGYHQIRFVPKNLSSGVYLVRMTAGTYTQSTKILFSK